jgi:hypothetical protein
VLTTEIQKNSNNNIDLIKIKLFNVLNKNSSPAIIFLIEKLSRWLTSEKNIRAHVKTLIAGELLTGFLLWPYIYGHV